MKDFVIRVEYNGHHRREQEYENGPRSLTGTLLSLQKRNLEPEAEPETTRPRLFQAPATDHGPPKSVPEAVLPGLWGALCAARVRRRAGAWT